MRTIQPCLFVLLLAVLLTGCGGPRWEYTSLIVKAEAANDKAAATTSPPEADLNKLGAEGWELVGCYSEPETVFPNFGNEEYHTGIKTNIRSLRAVLLFKRRAR